MKASKNTNPFKMKRFKSLSFVLCLSIFWISSVGACKEKTQKDASTNSTNEIYSTTSDTTLNNEGTTSGTVSGSTTTNSDKNNDRIEDTNLYEEEIDSSGGTTSGTMPENTGNTP